MNCIIIDDDLMSRRIIEEFISRTDQLRLLASFENAVDAINVFSSDEDVDLIFLDIEMPEMSGIDFLNTLTSPCQIIIISSKEKYALEAFEYNVTDYLLKPILYSRFFKAVEKAFSRFDKTKEFNLGFVSGLIDSEGHVNKKKSYILIVNTNKDILDKCKKFLGKIGIESSISKRLQSRKDKLDSYRMYVSVKFKRLKNLSIKTKRLQS